MAETTTPSGWCYLGCYLVTFSPILPTPVICHLLGSPNSFPTLRTMLVFAGVTRELLPIWAGPTTRLVGGDEVGPAGAGAVYHVADPPPEESVGQVAAGAEEATTTTAITPSSTITTAPGSNLDINENKLCLPRIR